MSRTLSSLNSGLIWAGAGISASAIVVGTWIAPLGWEQGLLAIILGHLLGGILFFAAGYIGAKTGKNAMQTVQISFGKGSVFFSLANVLQLIGWTAIMIYTGAEISNALSLALWELSAFSLWACVLGGLIILWLFSGSNQVGKLKLFTLIAMFVLTLWLSLKVLNGQNQPATSGDMPFSTAVELAIIMPLSWLPLVSDYTSKAKKPFAATLLASVGYLLTSAWMYALGLGMVLFTGQSEIAPMLLLKGMSLVGIIVMILSTVTTTFLDAYSAGVSASNISSKLKETLTAIAVTILGTLLALSLPVTQYENFLLLIGSVFAPMIAVQIADFFVLKRTESQPNIDWIACGLWFIGFMLYHGLSYSQVHLPLGLTIPVMLVIFVATVFVRKVTKYKNKRFNRSENLQNFARIEPLVLYWRKFMTKNHFFKLSAISVALFGIASQGYAVECQAPISLRGQQGVFLDNCSLERSVDKDSRIPGNTLINIDRSDLNILNSTINSKSDSYYARGMLNAEESKVTIKESNISHFAPSVSSRYVLRADGSDIMIDKSAIKGEDIFMLYLHRPSTINVNNSTFESEGFLVRDNSVWVGAPLAEKTTININNSKVLSKHLFNDFFGNYAESIDLNVNKSEIHGEAHLYPKGMLINMALADSQWTIPARGAFWHPNSVNNLEMSNSEVIFAKSSSEDVLFSFNILNIDGNLFGSGHFELNTNLFEQLSDKIVVKGEDSGDFTLGIKNSGNEPNAANGKVTLVETQQGQAQFSLKDRDYVDAGAYRYRLQKEGTNWVLSNRDGEKNTPVVDNVVPSEQTDPTPVTPPVTSTPTTTDTVVPATPVTPPVTSAPTTTDTVVSATPVTPPVTSTPTTTNTEIPTTPVTQTPSLAMLSEKSNALASLRQAQGWLLMQNLQGIHQRLGELKTDKTSNVWVKNTNSRTEGKAQKVAADSRSSGFEMDSHSVQIGADRAVSEQFRVGGFVGTSRANVDFNGEYGKGKLRSQAVGFYATFANDSGWYSDNVAKYERLSTQNAAEKRKYNGFSFSTELGKRIALSNDWSVTPQAQLAYHTLNGKKDESRLTLLTARAGVRVAKGFSLNNGWHLQPYVEANAIAEKANDATVSVNQYRFNVAENRGIFQTALGLTAGNGSHRLGVEISQTHGKQVKQPLNLLANYRYQW